MRESPGEVGVLYRDDHLLVLDKPSGLPTTTPSGGDCLVARARDLDPDAPRLHPSSRLDAEVTGVVVLARTRRATRALLAARRRERYRRRYVGLATGAPQPTAGRWDWPISLDPADPRRRIAGEGRGCRPARTEYVTGPELTGAVVLQLFPKTGRTHQLRVHCARAGVPLLGDVSYGGPRRLVREDGRVVTPRRVMLHCAEVRVPAPSDPTRELVLASPPPADLVRIVVELGGEAAWLAFTPERPERP